VEILIAGLGAVGPLTRLDIAGPGPRRYLGGTVSLASAARNFGNDP
jgi:hypothetical protein